MSAAAHLAEAERAERQATELEEGGGEARRDVHPSVAAVGEASTSGGEPLVRPRWTSSFQPVMEQQQQARRLRREAARHRQIAKDLLQAEKRACVGLHEEDIERGPFFHRRDIARVEPVERGGDVRGALVVFEAVPGLTARWMEQAVECVQARAAVLGYPRDYMRYSPLMLPGVMATVRMENERVAVVMESRDPSTAIEILGRAEALMRALPEEPAAPSDPSARK